MAGTARTRCLALLESVKTAIDGAAAVACCLKQAPRARLGSSAIAAERECPNRCQYRHERHCGSPSVAFPVIARNLKPRSQLDWLSELHNQSIANCHAP